ncbi:tail tape measure protein [Aneurinibacillus aneurinilyticus]|uniref:tail tape measure protein n=1 Tax=Aneurinibacillus aneurinilyticus TaxID=1391 RepID=UPI0023F43148|nr:tail tape measure protein [Aneurinibacillus aneurinilyticus]
MLRGTTSDLNAFRRASEDMHDNFVSGSRRARDAAQDFGREVDAARDDVRGLANEQVDDLFTHARSGAEDFRSTVSRAESEVKGLSHARVHLQARDDVSPVLDGISSKLAVIAATAGGLVLGGGVKDSLFGGVTEYTHEASRSAPYLSPADRKSALTKADELYEKGYFESRAEAAKQLADIAPLVKDKSQIGEFLESSAKMKYLMPYSSWEEINRSLGQATNVFKETPQQVTDSMMYTYKQVGDRQQDLFDSYWEYVLYFNKAGTNSAQMANFLVKSVQEGSFNFDKPADFFKETFGVKALDAGDMAKYFELRGSSKDVAEKQANDFTSDINSGDEQKAKGAIMALVADLASQTPAELKASLVQLGSATGQDNGDAITKTYKVPFEKPPDDINGTANRMVQTQQDANPMQEMIEARNQINKLLQDIGKDTISDILPVMQEFNNLLVTNKNEIQNLFSSFTGFIRGATSFYKEHFAIINLMIGALVGGFALKKGVDFVRGGIKFGKDMLDIGKSAFSTVGKGASTVKGWFTRSKDEETAPEKKKFTLRGNQGSRGDDRIRALSSMTVNATRVYVNGPVSGGGGGMDTGDRGRRKPSKGGRGINARDELTRRKKDNEDHSPPRRTKTVSRDKANDVIEQHRPPKPPDPPKRSIGKGLLRGAGVAGAVAGVGIGAYELYQSAKDGGLRRAASTSGGSVVGGLAGTAVGGTIGSLAGPLGTAAGAAVGNYIGDKLGSLADSSGVTAKVVDAVVSLKDTLGSWKNKAANFISGKKEEPTQNAVAGPPAPKPLPPLTLPTFTPQAKQKMQEMFTSFKTSMKQKGIEMDFTPIQKAGAKVKDTFSNMKQSVVGWWKGDSAKKAQGDLHAVGSATQNAAGQTKNLGAFANRSTAEIAQGSKQAGQSFAGVSAAAGTAAGQTKSHLETLKNVSSQGSSWGSNLISMMVAGIQSKFPLLSSVVSGVAGIIKKNLGFSSPTKEGPASKSDKWAPNFISMFASGLKADPIKQKMNLIAGTMNRKLHGHASVDVMQRAGNGIRVARSLNQAPRAAGSVSIQNITLDFGEMAKQVTDFAEFAKMLSGPQGRALIRKILGEELHKAIENGG